MASVTEVPPRDAQTRQEIPPLEQGDHLDQKTFHERYEAMPDGVKAELIGGIVYMPSPAKAKHGFASGELVGWLHAYKKDTPGTDVLDNATVILADDSEPQPDAALIIRPEFGGQIRINADDYLVGAPELAGEVASSSESYDLHSKRHDYERAGVQEYLVVALRQRRVWWFTREGGQFSELAPGADGILRSRVFPGLWLDPEALVRRDTKRMDEVLQQGLASPEHAEFVRELAGRRTTP